MIDAAVEGEGKEVEGEGTDYEPMIQLTIDFISIMMIPEINLSLMRRILVLGRSLI